MSEPRDQRLLRRLYLEAFGSRIRRNVVAGSASMAANVILLLAAYPIYLRYLDYATYGLWLVLSTVLTFTQLGSLGISQAITKYVAEHHARGDVASIEGDATAALALVGGTGGLLAAVVALGRGTIPPLFGLAPPAAAAVEPLLPAVGLMSAHALLAQVYVGVLTGLGAVDRANYLQVASRALALGSSWALLAGGHGLVGLVVGNWLSYLFLHLAVAASIRRGFGVRCIVPASAWRRGLPRLLRLGGGVFGGSLMNLALHPLNRILLSRFAGVSALPVFEIAFGGAMQLRAFIEAGLRSLLPEFSRAEADGTPAAEARLRGLLNKAERVVWLAGTACYFAAFALAPWMLELWLGSRLLPAQVPVFRGMLAASFASLLGVPAYYMLMAAGRSRAIFFAHALQSLANLAAVAAGVVLLGQPGLSWFVLSVTIGMACTAAYLWWAGRRHLSRWMVAQPIT